MPTTVPNRRTASSAFVTELAWPLLFLALGLAFTVPFFILKTSHATSNEEPRCLPNGEAIFPWNRTVNEHWDSSTALFITLGSGSYTYPEAKAIDVFFDLVVGRGGQVLAAIMAFTVIRKSLLLSIEERPVPLPLTFSVYFNHVSPSLVGAILQNLAIPFRARKHKDKAVSSWRLLAWLYLCAYVLVLPTLLSAMTGYQTTGAIWFQPEFTSDNSLASAASLAPNPALSIRDGSRIGLSDNEAVSLNLTQSSTGQVDNYYNAILGYYFAIENALYNATWHLTVSEITDPGLQGQGPGNSAGVPAWAYCTVSQTGNYCAAEGQYGSTYATPPSNAPELTTPEFTWSNITLNNKTHVLQPPPLDIVWAAPATTWSLVLDDAGLNGGYFTNASIAQTAVCQPSAQYQWGFSTALLFLFSCMTIAFAATLLGLEATVWLYSRSNLYQQRRSGYRDAVDVVQALKEEFGDEVLDDSPEDIDSRVKSYTGAIRVETENLGMSRRQSGLPSRNFRGRTARMKGRVQPDIPLLEPSGSEGSAAKTTWRQSN
ncbi:hypothetical protein B0A55_05565 [Friedmanniomyces simplex]|uniref:Uncharacterized protein n=1 Tax=Friedmanniomyces simplex TaxID=329884 RepID=A0A4U0XKQ1_9PEZI|nr:hypothetical protein B0A55_05565 [Friedmanniomyces simplex]